MSKTIDIKGSSLVRHDMPGNHIRIVASDDTRVVIDDAEILVAHQQTGAATGNVAAGSSESGNGKPVGPFDQFTGPWKAGDRQPTEMEQIMKPDWFRDLPDGRTGTDEQGGGGPSATVGFVLGGIVKIGYPQGNRKLTRVTGCVPGLVAYDIGPVLLGKGPGVARVSIAQESSGDAAGKFAVATEPGVLVGPSVIGSPYEGNMPVFNIGVTADMPKLYVNAQYSSVSANQLVQVEAHDRV